MCIVSTYSHSQPAFSLLFNINPLNALFRKQNYTTTQMAKRFKLKFSRVITSFQFCRSRDPSTIPETPAPAIYRLSPVNPKAVEIAYPNLPAPPPSTPENSFVKRRLSPKIASSVGCGCRARSSSKWYRSTSDNSTDSPEMWRKEAARLHRVAKAQESKLQQGNYKVRDSSFSGESNGDMSPVMVRKCRNVSRDKQKEKKMKMRVKTKAKASLLSGDSGWFSNREEENDETETLISTSISFSDDSFNELDHSIESTIESSNTEIKRNKKKGNVKKVKRLRRYPSINCRGGSNVVSKTKKAATEDTGTAARSGTYALQREIPSTVEGKVRESVAVVKKSKDPHEDFKRSMLEMILEKEMFEAEDLEQLLHCFLSLNSRQYHEVIVEAFAEIWEVLFCDSDDHVNGQ